MISQLNTPNLVLISISVISGAIALTLACVGIGSSDWQTTSANSTNGQMYTDSTANFFYACLIDMDGDTQCGQRSSDNTNIQYYMINATGDESDWNLHLNFAAGLSIIGIIFIFIGSLTTLLMFFGEKAAWVYLIAPTFLFVACLFMLAGLAEGARVLQYNGYAAHLYETAHVLTIFSFLISALLAGRLYDLPLKPQQPKTLKRTK
jgi:hypothetical protein